jgi:amino-acid N-acetyltransferase
MRRAADADVPSILRVLRSNVDDRSLFQQPEHQVRKTLGDFFVTVGEDGGVTGCAALHWHSPENAEILAVAVSPELQGKGVGGRLMKECIAQALRTNADVQLWLATAKPQYFARFGFHPVSRFRLPAGVLWTKFRLIFQQPAGRWIPAIAGRHTFMVHRQSQAT